MAVDKTSEIINGTFRLIEQTTNKTCRQTG